jgi:hypothetical protein
MLPSQRSLIERADSPVALWIELQGLFGDSVKKDDGAEIRQILAHASCRERNVSMTLRHLVS